MMQTVIEKVKDWFENTSIDVLEWNETSVGNANRIHFALLNLGYYARTHGCKVIVERNGSPFVAERLADFASKLEAFIKDPTGRKFIWTVHPAEQSAYIESAVKLGAPNAMFIRKGGTNLFVSEKDPTPGGNWEQTVGTRWPVDEPLLVRQAGNHPITAKYSFRNHGWYSVETGLRLSWHPHYWMKIP